ncbi:MAG: hypothetical protein JSU86_16820 [Phycisphaerales bacterium]|nr:MAG: hypothetical protein JSU86_16820 [Phycisphaerales bacterium]
MGQHLVIDEQPSAPPGTDCNGTGHSEACDILIGFSDDCNDNGSPDECDIDSGSSPDCTGNGIPDECEPDCNQNGEADSRDIDAGLAKDCQPNGVPDVCDIADGTSGDVNDNDIPDECDECPPVNRPNPEEALVPKNRYLSLTSGNAGHQTAMRVTYPSPGSAAPSDPPVCP